MGRLTNILRRWFPGAVSEGVTPGNEEEHVVSRVSAGEEIPRDAKRVDVVSDTHGRLSSELVRAIKDADLVIHAGDITSESDWGFLCAAHPEIRAVLGNNDGFYNYEPELPRVNRFTYEGLRFSVAHYREELPLGESDVAVCGHTHRAVIEQVGPCLVVNPGSASLPRGRRVPTIARLYVKAGRVYSAEIVDLE